MSGSSSPRAWLPSLRHAGLVLLGSAALLWCGWTTKSVTDLQNRRIVTVRLGAMIEEFVAAEARAQRSPQDAQARLALYLKGIESVVNTLGKDGTTVLVAEAVISGSAPDYSPKVKADLDLWMTAHGAH
jgi:conjugal transfer pilin signal peptidase TrbI